MVVENRYEMIILIFKTYIGAIIITFIFRFVNKMRTNVRKLKLGGYRLCGKVWVDKKRTPC